MATTPNEVSEGAACFDCISKKQAALLYLLNQIRIAQGGAVMTIAEIESGAACFDCINKKDAAALYLLDTFASGGGGGSGGESGAGSPEGVVTASPGTTYYNTSDGSFWAKGSGTGDTGWVALIT